MKYVRWVVVLIAVAAAASWAVVGDVRGPITILGDRDFTAENGVVSGSGAVDDPYVIAGWEISAGSGASHGVKIENVTAAFILRGLIVRGVRNADGVAIRIGLSAGGEIDGCTVSDSTNGIDIVSSTAVAMRNCVLYVTGRGLRVLGETAEQYRHTIEESNELNGYPIVYLHGLDGETIEGRRTTHLTVADSRNVMIVDNEVVNGDGIQLAFVTDATVQWNDVYRLGPVRTEHGIHLYRSDRNVVRGNSLRNNNLAAVQLSLATQNEIVENEMLANDTGVRLVASDENRISANIVFANVTGIDLIGGSSGNEVSGNIIYHENTKQGISLELAIANRIERNMISDAEIGVTLSSSASNNDVVANTIVAGDYGISVAGAFNDIERNLLSQQMWAVLFPETLGETMTRGNSIRGNVFTDNSHHVYVNLDSFANEFAENAFLGRATALIADHGTDNRWTIDGVGNYWGEASVADENGDGIGDSPVVVYPSEAQDVASIVAIDPREAGVGILSTAESGSAVVDLPDGTSVDISVLYADEGHERWVGYRGFPEALLDGYFGILFLFEDEDERLFVMTTVPFDLDIAFFDAEGKLVGRREPMTANSEEAYTAPEPFQYALELPGGSLQELGIGADARLRVP